MSKGFTIIEAIIVMAIVGVLAIVTVPRLITTSTVAANEGAQMMAADIRKTQDLAMADTASHQIQFTNGSNSYVIDPSGANPQTMTLPQGVTTTTTTTITFSTTGDPGLTADSTITVGGVSVVVTQNTGKVTVGGSTSGGGGSPGC